LQCPPQELAGILTAFNKIAIAFDSYDNPSDVGFKSRVLNEIISSLPKLKEPMKDILSIVSLKKAAEGQKDTMWNDPERYPDIADMDMVCLGAHVGLRSLLSHGLPRLYKLLRWS
jgi:DNA mismatch repair protein MSH3